MATLLMAAIQPAAAEAGKFCADVTVEGGMSSAVTQEEALKAAQGWWSSRAGALGRDYAEWDNADEQALECGKDIEGNYRCKATARPCLAEGAQPDEAPRIDM